MRQLLTRVPDELHARLVAQAEREGRSITSLVVAVLSAALDGEHLDRRGRLRARAAQIGLEAPASDPGEPAPQEAAGLTTAHGLGAFIDEFLNEDRGWDRYTNVGFTPPADERTAPAGSGSAQARPADSDARVPVIVYLDSSVLARTFLPDEPGHEQATALVDDPEVAAVTWLGAVMEVTGALVRADRAGRAPASVTLPLFGTLVRADGAVTVLDPPSARLHRLALSHAHGGLHALDAYHLAVAEIALPALAEPGERRCFATGDSRQAQAVREAAARVGFDVL